MIVQVQGGWGFEKCASGVPYAGAEEVRKVSAAEAASIRIPAMGSGGSSFKGGMLVLHVARAAPPLACTERGSGQVRLLSIMPRWVQMPRQEACQRPAVSIPCKSPLVLPSTNHARKAEE